jgi:hypothetical protein
VTDTPGSAVPARLRWAILLVLAAIFLATGLYQAAHDAPTVDEGVDVSSGVTSLVRHDLRMSPEHAALPKALAALPSLLAHPVVPDTKAYRSGAWFDYSSDFVAANERAGRLRPLLFWNRTVLLAEGLACAALLYALASRWFGPDGGLIVAACWLTTPYVVGLSHLAMVDIPFTLATLAVCLALARWRERPDTARAVVLGLTLGLALASRHTALVLLAVAVVVVIRELRTDTRQAARAVGTIVVLAIGAVWVVYRLIAPSTSRSVAAASLSPNGAIAKLVNLVPLPWEWRAGFTYLDLTSGDRSSSLFGQSWMGGRWWYFPASAALKVALPLVVAIVVGWVLASRGQRAGSADAGTSSGPATGATDRVGLALVVVLPAVALWLFLLSQPLNLGLRLALPTVALAYVGLGALAAPLARVFAAPRAASPDEAPADTPAVRTRASSMSTRVLVGAAGLLLVGSQLASMAAAGPHSLAFTPVPWTPAYRWVSDSNVDAGQGLYELRAWARHHPGAYVAYDRTRGLEVEGGTRPLKGVRPSSVRGWVAAGVTPLMQTRRAGLLWLHKYCPVGTVAGGSILLYRFTSAPDPSPGPERPVAPCFGARASHD